MCGIVGYWRFDGLEPEDTEAAPPPSAPAIPLTLAPQAAARIRSGSSVLAAVNAAT